MNPVIRSRDKDYLSASQIGFFVMCELSKIMQLFELF